VDQGATNAHKEMMFDTDMCLIQENNRERQECLDANVLPNSECKALYKDSGLPILAERGNCCSYIWAGALFKKGIYTVNETNDYCGVEIMEKTDVKNRRACCSNID